MKTSLARNSHGGECDNRAVVLKMVKLRAERAALLGYANHAALSTGGSDRARISRRSTNCSAQLAPPAVANARKEAADMQKLIDKDQGGFQLASWDWALLCRESSAGSATPLMNRRSNRTSRLNHVLQDGVFYAANQLYGITFKERHDLPVYQPDVRVFEVFDKDGQPLAIFIG